jgi:uncharacterized protein
VTVAIARVTLFLGGSHSLKDKRMVLRRLKDLVHGKFNAAIAEVGEDNDLWQRATVGVTLVGNDRRFTESALDQVLAFIREQAEVVKEERELQSFGREDLQGSDFVHWEP